MIESQKQTPHVLTKDESKELEKYEREKKIYSFISQPKFKKYDYFPTGRFTFYANRDSYIRDSDSVRIENRIGDLLIDLYRESEAVRIDREAREAAKRKAEEEARQKELRQKRYNEEVDRLTKLNNEANDYQMACMIRAYVAAVESKPDLDQAQNEWIAWEKQRQTGTIQP